MSDPDRTPPAPDAGMPPQYWHSQEMLLLKNVIALIGRGLDIDTVMRETLHLLSEMLGLNRGRIVLQKPGEDVYRIRCAYGLKREEIERGVYRLGEGITGRALKNRQLLIVQDIDQDPTFLMRAVKRQDLPQEPVAFLAMPIPLPGHARGVIACHRLRNRDRKISDDITILKMMATLIGQLIELNAAVEQRSHALRRHNDLLSHALESATARYGIVGTSPPLLRAVAQLEQVSNASATVLLLGESGTGKELFARALHLSSPRRDRPFIKVNCAAIPESLFESELFGHERGAFTGATESRAGWFEQADTGTIFLDEIGDMPLSLQGKLLRTLQEGTISRLGGKREMQVNVRLVAATNHDLKQAVTEQRFRADLYYRLNVIPIRLPSLAQRVDDVPLLISFFLNRFNQHNDRNVHLTAEAISRLSARDWPGNIRQLSNMIERIVLLARSPTIGLAEIDSFLRADDRTDLEFSRAAALAPVAAPQDAPIDRAYRPYAPADSHSWTALQEALRASGGNKSRAAQALGLTTRQLAYRLQRLGGQEG